MYKELITAVIFIAALIILIIMAKYYISARSRRIIQEQELVRYLQNRKRFIERYSDREASKDRNSHRKRIAAEVTGIATTGGFIGWLSMTMSGMNAVGIVGAGIGTGAPAGPVGSIIGAAVFLAAWGIIKTFNNSLH